MEEEIMNPTEASAEAVHKVRNAQQAIEVAREAQMAQMVEQTAQQTKDALLEGLKEVFGGGDSKDPQQMKILVARIPILCLNIERMHSDISDIKDNQKWANRALLGGIVSVVVAVTISMILK